ncbi:DUF4333 domain-containing protein [Frankia nepalensis]|uniref:DUF4333 domain-containing protein n=1 Tax=Frankia nepalensis TaxID=1836974 RepID=A0A937R5S3_9ACTN|nr:DUF4333 domain-containing protein [Frankia nepalensis]MBL7502446.1 DUF4333 domain-containing protein [Frankia nepalensis]MBL7516323.1 DUF4333 domain-containing protein [Frankia nepalensis]MBL7625761.1 DUF4333 domain-containing protein [Frankia nepalensis]
MRFFATAARGQDIEGGEVVPGAAGGAPRGRSSRLPWGVGIVLVAAVVTVGAAGCSDSDDDADSTATPVASVTASAALTPEPISGSAAPEESPAPATSAPAGSTGPAVVEPQPVSGETLEQQIEGAYQARDGKLNFEVDCPTDLEGAVGASVNCTLTSVDNGDQIPVTVRATEIAADGTVVWELHNA